MNRERRKQIEEILTKLQDIQSDLESLKDDVQDVADMEQGYLDNMPENLQNSEKAERTRKVIDELVYGIEELENAYSSVEQTINFLDCAKD